MITDSPLPLKLLIVDDDPSLLTVLEAGLAMLPGIRAIAVSQAAEALALLRRDAFDLIVTDYSLGDPAANGLTILGVGQQQPSKPLTIIITAYASLQISLQSIELGAFDFITKPFQMEELQLVVRNAAELVRARRANTQLREQLQEMGGMLAKFERDHEVLAGRFKQLASGYDASGTDSGFPAAALDGPAAQELRRRRMREQVNNYQRMSDTLLNQSVIARGQIMDLIQGAEPVSPTAPEKTALRPALAAPLPVFKR